MRWLDGTEIGRNDSCICGSGLKFKNCCINILHESTKTLPGKRIGVILTYEDLWPKKNNLPQIARDILTDFEPFDLIQVLSKVGVIMRESFYKPMGSEEKQFVLSFFTPVERKKIQSWLITGRRNKLLTRQTILAAIQIAIEHANDTKRRHSLLQRSAALGEALLRLNSFIENESEINLYSKKSEKDRVLRAMFLRNIFFSHRRSFGPSIGRYWAIVKKGFPAVKQKYSLEYFDLEKTFHDLFGFTIEQMIGQAFAIWGHYKMKPLKEIFDNPNEFLLGENYFRNLKSEVRSNAKSIFDFLKADLTDLNKFVREELSNFPLPNHFAFAAFWNHPLFDVGNGAYVPLDIGFLEDRMTEGIYWSVFNELSRRKEDSALELLRQSFGRALEWYVGQHLKDAIGKDSDSCLWLEWDEKVEGVDAVIREGKTLFLLEITSSGLHHKTRISCDPNRIEAELETVWFGKGRKSAKLIQLFEAFESAKKNKLKMRNFDYSEIENIVPVLVTLQSMPQHGMLWEWYHRLIKEQKISSEFIDKLIFLDPEEVEMLCHLKREGKRWSELVKGKQLSDYRGEPFGDYLFFQVFESKDVEIKYLMKQWTEEAFSSITMSIFDSKPS